MFYGIFVKRLLNELRRLERLESKNKFILDVNPIAFYDGNKPPTRFHNTPFIDRFHEKDTFTFQGRILPQTEPYCRAAFPLQISIPPEHPFKPPDVTILDSIYHPHINELGKDCCCWSFKPTEPFWMRPSLTDIITVVLRLIDTGPDYDHICNCQCAEEYQNDYETFYKKALELTLSYGRPRC